MKSSVSVIIAAFNVSKQISRAIESAQQQTGVDLEIIVVDDGSTDGTCDVVRQMASSDARIQLIEAKVNAGPSAARNLAFAACSKDWIAILDADDAWKPERLVELIAFAHTHRADVVADNQIFYDEALQLETGLGFSQAQEVQSLTVAAFLDSDMAGLRLPFGMLKPVIRREKLAQLGYRPELRFAEDFVFGIELLLNGLRYLVSPEAYYIYTAPVGKVSGIVSTGSRTEARDDMRLWIAGYLEKKYNFAGRSAQSIALRRYKARARQRIFFQKLTKLRNERKYVQALLSAGIHPRESVKYISGGAKSKANRASIAAVANVSDAQTIGANLAAADHVKIDMTDASVDADHCATAFDLSLLICTKDRAVSLAKTLEAVTVAWAATSNITLQVILVDNGSYDDTANVITSWAASQSFPVEMVYEGRPGVACARNAGLGRVAGRIVAMTDDDCRPHPDFLTAVCRAFANPFAPAVIGGRIKLGDPEHLPITIKDLASPLTLSPSRFPAGFIMGANMAFPGHILEHIGLFDERFGAGGQYPAGEDTDFLIRAMALGYPIQYDPSFVVDHHHGRKAKDEAIKLAKGYYHADGALYAKYIMSDRRIRLEIWRDIKRIFRELLNPPSERAISDFSAFFKLRHRSAGFYNFVGDRFWSALFGAFRRRASKLPDGPISLHNAEEPYSRPQLELNRSPVL